MSTWAWGLRRYAWVVVLFVVGLGVLVPLAQSRAADVYETHSQVGPSRQLLLPNPTLHDYVGGDCTNPVDPMNYPSLVDPESPRATSTRRASGRTRTRPCSTSATSPSAASSASA